MKVSFEFFPPRTAAGAESFGPTVARLGSLGPRFFSVTCGANGSNRESTFATVRRIKTETGIPAAAHVTCVGASRREIEHQAHAYWNAGVRRIVAVRGDAPAGSTRFEKHPDGFTNATELVAALKRVADFEISVAAYPEVHPESSSSRADLDNLKRKADAGATSAITQFFFDTDVFLRFADRARAHGISIPIVAGILPVANYAQAAKFAQCCGATIPIRVTQLFEGLDQDSVKRHMVSASFAAGQCRRLQAAGFHEFHFYTLNRPELSYAVCHMLGLRAQGHTA